MAVPDKQMGKADLESFLKQQFPNSKEVNSLLEQINVSKNVMERAMGEEIPSFYGTISKYISQHTVNGISDWISSNGQVNTTQINRAAQTAKKVYVEQKRQEQQAQHEKLKQEQLKNETENIGDKVAEEELSQIDFNNIKVEDIRCFARNFSVAVHSEGITQENKKKISDIICETMGLDEFYKIVIDASIDPSIMQKPEVQTIIKDHPLAQEFFNRDGVKQKAADNFLEMIGGALDQILSLKPEDRTKEAIEQILKFKGLDIEKLQGCYDINIILENVKEDRLQEMLLQINKQSDEIAQTREADTEQITSEGHQRWVNANNIQSQVNTTSSSKADEVINAVINQEMTRTSEFTQDDMEDVFTEMFVAVIDPAEQVEEMGLPVQEGEGYTTFFEPSEQELVYEQEQMELGENADPVQDELVGQEPQLAQDETVIGIDDAQLEQGEVARGGAEQSQEHVAREALGEDNGKVAAVAGGVIGMFQTAAREEPNDYKNLQKDGIDDRSEEEPYQSPTFEDKSENEKGGILGFFSKIKNAVQARFAKKPEQKRLEASVEQRTDENGWTVTTYDGNGKDLMPRGTGLRNAMVRFAENTVGRLGKFVSSNQRSSEPVNNRYVVPTNVQTREDKQQTVTKDPMQNLIVPKDQLSPLQHNTQPKSPQQRDDGQR